MKKSLLCIFLALLMVFTALPMTALSASALENFSQGGMCAWWDGTSVKWHMVSGADHYDLRVFVVRPKGDQLYDFIMSKVISFDINFYGNPSSFYEDGTLNRDFNIHNIVTRQDDTITVDVKEWLGFITDDFEYEFTLAAQQENVADDLASYHCELVSGKALTNGYKGLGGVVNLDGVPSDGEPNAGQWIYATVTDCNIPVSSLKYTWEYYDNTYVYNYYWMYTYDGKVVPGSDNSATLRGVGRDMLGKYVRLVVTADGYDGTVCSALFYYSYHTITVDGGTAYSYGQEGSEIKAQKGDKVFLTAPKKDDYTFTKWEVLSGGVTIADPTVATNASFTLGDSDVSVKANYKKNTPISTLTVTGITEPVPDAKPTMNYTLPANCGYAAAKVGYGDVAWYKENGDLLNPETDKFVAGEKYRVQMSLVAQSGYEFATSGLTATINGATASVSVNVPKFIVTVSTWYTCPVSSATYTVSGTVTSFLNEGDSVGLWLSKSAGSFPSMRYITGNEVDFSFTNIPAGNYTLKVMKKNHVAREYSVTVNGDTTVNAQINPIGDANLNGKVQSNDAMLAYKHAQGKAEDQLTGYAAKCADVNNNGKIQSNDAMTIYKQAQGQHSLW
ncbi:MAG: dockerin type I repeat-containing protein [Ruminococcus sp.]|nr:dockerin type I repeat-containing protein [Ruminococcus sp.]